MKEIGKMKRKMDKVFSLMKMETSIVVVSKITKDMVKVGYN